MRLARRIALVAGVAAVAMVAAYLYIVAPHRSSAPVNSAQYLLDEADTLSWGNLWTKAGPLYGRAEALFLEQGNPSKALYARVSQIPPHENMDLRATIAGLTDDLRRPEASDPEIRLRILTIRGMLETNYDAGAASATWTEIGILARRLHHYELATRALGEQGIAAFLMGDTETAKSDVIKAWTLSKVEKDPAATVRYAAVFGAGLVQVHRYKEALTPLDEAIRTAAAHSGVAYPTIAVYAKISALTGLHRTREALALANSSMRYIETTPLDGHKAQLFLIRGDVYRDEEQWDAATGDYAKAVAISKGMNNDRGIVDGSGLLAQAYLHTHNLPAALSAIDEALAANTRIPSELYLAPRNLATKADILARMGRGGDAENVWRDAITLTEAMLQHAATRNVERELLSETAGVYSGYYASLASHGRYADALRVLERIRGRVEAEALEHHATSVDPRPGPEERELTRLNLQLIETSSPALREAIDAKIYTTELAVDPSTTMRETIVRPVALNLLQRTLGPTEVVLEYVLAEPQSYVLVVSSNAVTSRTLPGKALIESGAKRYVSEIHAKKEDSGLAHALYDELLGPVEEVSRKKDLIVVPDGALHLLPFAALAHGGAYVLTNHTVDVVPSSTVFSLLRKRADSAAKFEHPYVGVAAWTERPDTRPALVRAVAGPLESELLPLPQSRAEVESIAHDLPAPSTILLGGDATETHFKDLARNDIEVVHLALHGYVDLDYPDRSALVFAREAPGGNDSLLQVREIRELRLHSKLVTLSACNTGIGPVGEAGIANIVNAFIEAGAVSVVSSLWEVEDRATRHLMETFYGHLASHERKVDALRAAQLDVFEQGYPPYFWAGVQLVGDPDGTL